MVCLKLNPKEKGVQNGFRKYNGSLEEPGSVLIN